MQDQEVQISDYPLIHLRDVNLITLKKNKRLYLRVKVVLTC